MAKPFQEQVNIQPQTISTGQPQLLMSLSEKLDNFAADRAQDIAQKQIQEATIKGQQAGVAQQKAQQEARARGENASPLELKEETFIGGISKKAFNTAAREGYLKSLDNDNIEQITNMATENSTNLAGFNDAVNAYAKGVLGGVDPASRGAVEMSIDSMVSRYRPKIQAAQAKQVMDNANQDQAINADERSRLAQSSAFDGDMEQTQINMAAAIDSIANNTSLEKSEKAEKIRTLQVDVMSSSIGGDISRIYEKDGAEAAFEAIQSMSKPKDFTPDEWNTFVGATIADVNQSISLDAKAAATEQIDISREVSNLKIQANTGIGDSGELIKQTERLFTKGDISEAERTSIITNIVNGQKKIRKEASDDSLVANKIAGQDGIVLTNDQIDSYYKRNLNESLNELPADEGAAAKAQFVERVKKVPTLMKNEIVNGLRSENPELIASSADMIDRLDTIPGLVDRDFSATDRAYGRIVSDLSENLAPAEAVKLAQDLTNPNDKARVEARQAQLKVLVKASPDMYADAIDDEFSPLFGADLLSVSNAPAMTKEYQSLFDAHYTAGMDESNAKQKALQIMGRNWSGFEGKAIKYSPADYYQVGGDTTYVKDQLYSDITEGQILPFEFTRDDIVIMGNNPHTSRTASTGQPEYLVMVDGGDQGIIQLTGFFWKPDVQAEIDRRKGMSAAEVKQLRERKSEPTIKGITRGLK